MLPPLPTPLSLVLPHAQAADTRRPAGAVGGLVPVRVRPRPRLSPVGRRRSRQSTVIPPLSALRSARSPRPRRLLCRRCVTSTACERSAHQLTTIGDSPWHLTTHPNPPGREVHMQQYYREHLEERGGESRVLQRDHHPRVQNCGGLETLRFVQPERPGSGQRRPRPRESVDHGTEWPLTTSWTLPASRRGRPASLPRPDRMNETLNVLPMNGTKVASIERMAIRV